MSKSKRPPVAVFVYGSLKEGHRLHGWMQGSAIMHPEAYLYDHALISLGPYPALIDLSDLLPVEQAVSGQVFLMPFARYQQLRVMEERVGYKATEVSVIVPHVGDDVSVTCHTFVFASIEAGLHSWEIDDEDSHPSIHVHPL